MTHRSNVEEPIFMKKMLSDEAVEAKNMAEIAMRYNISDPNKLSQIFSSTDPHTVYTITVEEDKIDKKVPMTLSIASYNLAGLHDRACVVMIAPRESGKTVFTYQMLATKSFIPVAHCTSTTDGASGYYQSFMHENNVRLYYDSQHQHYIVDSQERCADIFKEELQKGRFFDPRCIMVEDDCAWNQKMHGDSAMDKVATSGRHFHIFGICCVQRMKRVSPTFRDNCDLVVLFAVDNQDVRTEVWKQYGASLTKNSFLKIWDEVCSTPYHALVICCRGRDRYKSLQDRIFHFKAYEEEAVDALIGGGECSEEGEVLKPPRFYWKIGKEWQGLPPEEQANYADLQELRRANLMEEVVIHEEDEEEEEMEKGFQPSPYSLTERELVKRRNRIEKMRAETLKKVIEQIEE